MTRVVTFGVRGWWVDLDIAVTVAIGVALTVGLLRWWRSARAPVRRTLAVPFAAALHLTLLATATAVAVLLRLPPPVTAAVSGGLAGAWFCVVALTWWWHRAHVRRTRWQLAAVAFGSTPGGTDPVRIQAALRTALGDSGLRLLCPVDRGGFVDVDGRVSARLPVGVGQAATPVRRGLATVAVIVHDDALCRAPELTAIAATSTAVALEEVALHARVADMERSRRSIAGTTVAERQRIQRDVHDGAQQSLVAAAIMLDVAKRQLPDRSDAVAVAVGQAQDRLNDAIRVLREQVAGIYPQALTDGGVAEALEVLCADSPIPVTVQVPRVRWPACVEFVAYRTVADTLKDIVGQGADWAAITVTEQGGALRIDIDSTGSGNPSGAVDGGRRVLHDWVGIAGGRLDLRRTSDTSTALRVELPLHVR